MTTPAVSVIVPNYNHARYLRARLDSILGQTVTDFDIVLLDDCSTDDSRQILSQYADHPKVSHLVFNDTNTGSACAQWSRGIALARGELIWIAESDDLADPHLLEVLYGLLTREPAAVLAYCDSHFIDEHGAVFPESATRPPWSAGSVPIPPLSSGRDTLLNNLRHYNTIPNASAVLFRRSAAQRTEIPSGYRFCGDWLFWARMATHGKVAYSSQRLNYFRNHFNTTRAEQSAAAMKRRTTETLRVLDEIHHSLLAIDLPPTIHPALRGDWTARDAHLPWFLLRESGIPWSLRWTFFRSVIPYRALWLLRRWFGWMPGARTAFRCVRRLFQGRPSSQPPTPGAGRSFS